MKKNSLKLLLILIFTTQLLAAGNESVKSKDGVKIIYSVAGTGDPALVFIHGWSCDKSYWSEQLNEFSKKYKVVAIDLGGHGNSGTDRTDWTMQAFGEDVAAVVNHLKLNKIVLVGHSMGGSVIIEAAKILKGKVLGLIGVDTYQSFKDDWTEQQKNDYLKQFDNNFFETTVNFVKNMFPLNADSVLVKKISEDMAGANETIAKRAIRNLFFYDPVPSLKEINLPIITINSDMYPVTIDENKKSVESFEVKIIPGTGHFLMIEKPKLFNLKLFEAVTELTSK